MPLAYSAEYRSMVLEQTQAGAKAADLAQHLEVSEATIHRWIAQDKIDQGERPGNTTTDNAELRAARRRIAELETELAATKRASELFAEDRGGGPKRAVPDRRSTRR